jgi:hypothetical protein
LLQLLGVSAYQGLLAILYWPRLTDVAAVAVIVGLCFLSKVVVDSAAISIARLSPLDPESSIRSPTAELFKALSFLAVGLGTWIDFANAVHTGLVPGTVPTVVIHFVLVCVFAICVAYCIAPFTAALKNRRRR